MSLIESAPQKPKQYDERKQDHGDAAQQKGRETSDYWENKSDRHGLDKRDDEQFALDLKDFYQDLYANPDQIEEAADALLGESAIGFEDLASEPENQDAFATEAEVGLKSKNQIKKEMAKRATIDVEFDREDDDGDNDFHVPVHITTRP